MEDGEEYIYDIEFHKLHDMQGKLIGSFAKIQDTITADSVPISSDV